MEDCVSKNRPITMSDATEYNGILKLMAVTYAAWKRAMTMALISERCLDIVKHNEDKPEPPLPMPAGANANARAVCELTRATEKYCTRWDDYRARYGKAGWLINQSLTKESET